MKMVKSLLLGSAAGMVAVAGAQAADLPVKAKAVEYVKICSLYGAGFYYIPGTDTCIRIGGAIRLDTAFNGTTYDVPFWQGGANGANSYNRNYYSTRERFNLNMDTRTATEYGVVRTFGQGNFNFDTQGNSTANPNALNTNLANNPNLLNTPGGVVDLRTGKLRPHSSGDYMTKITAVGPWNGNWPQVIR